MKKQAHLTIKMKRILLFVTLIFLTLSSRAVDVFFSLPDYNAIPATNRFVTIQFMSPTVGNLWVTNTGASNGFWYSNFPPLTLANVIIKAPPASIPLQFYVPSLSFSGGMSSTNFLASGSASTYPAGQVAPTFMAAYALFAPSGSSQSNQFYPLGSNPSNYVNTATASALTNNLPATIWVLGTISVRGSNDFYLNSNPSNYVLLDGVTNVVNALANTLGYIAGANVTLTTNGAIVTIAATGSGSATNAISIQNGSGNNTTLTNPVFLGTIMSTNLTAAYQTNGSQTYILSLLGTISGRGSNDFYLNANPSNYVNLTTMTSTTNNLPAAIWLLGTISGRGSNDFYLNANPSNYITLVVAGVLTNNLPASIWTLGSIASRGSNDFYLAANPSIYQSDLQVNTRIATASNVLITATANATNNALLVSSNYTQSVANSTSNSLVISIQGATNNALTISSNYTTIAVQNATNNALVISSNYTSALAFTTAANAAAALATGTNLAVQSAAFNAATAANTMSNSLLTSIQGSTNGALTVSSNYTQSVANSTSNSILTSIQGATNNTLAVASNSFVVMNGGVATNLTDRTKFSMGGMPLLTQTATNVIGTDFGADGNGTWILSTTGIWTNTIDSRYTINVSAGNLTINSNGIQLYIVATVNFPSNFSVGTFGAAPAPVGWYGVTNEANGQIIPGNPIFSGTPSIPAYDTKIAAATNGLNGTLINIATAAAQGVVSNPASIALFQSTQPTITISAKGIANGLSSLTNDGKMYGPDTPGTTTCGWQEMINAFPYATNDGPVTAGAYVRVAGGYYYYTNQIYYTNNHPFDLFIQGSGIAGSKLVYAGSTVFGTTNVDYSVNPTAEGNGTIVFEPGTNATSLINKHLHLTIKNMGFSAINNVTNVLVYIDGQNIRGGYSYVDIEECDFESWYALTNQVVGAVLSKEWPGSTPAGVNIPGLVGLWINSTSEHQTMVKNCFFSGLAVGAYIQVDHLESEGLKFAYVGVDPGAPSGGVTNQWGTNYIFSLGAAAIFSCAQFPEIINFGHCWVSPGGAVLYGPFSGEFNTWIFETGGNQGMFANTIAATGTNLPNFFNEYDYNLGVQVKSINEFYAPGNSLYHSTGYQMAVGTPNPYALTMNANQQGAANPFDIYLGGTNIFNLNSGQGFINNIYAWNFNAPFVSTLNIGSSLALGGGSTSTLGNIITISVVPNTNYILVANSPTSAMNGLYTLNAASWWTNVNSFSNALVNGYYQLKKVVATQAFTNTTGIGPVGIGTWTNTAGLLLTTLISNISKQRNHFEHNNHKHANGWENQCALH